jgi:hypothetical protein
MTRLTLALNELNASERIVYGARVIDLSADHSPRLARLHATHHVVSARRSHLSRGGVLPVDFDKSQPPTI